MSEASDLECLDAAAEYVRKFGIVPGKFVGGRAADRGVALVDAALVRVLAEWSVSRNPGLLTAHASIADRWLPRLGREARRRLGR